ncbi:hypothetical protein NHU_04425 (plasmid) [Rhodovulum sulfidophilum]|uniref:Replication-associated protein ORF2/G2P domain-containing protein n=1 Tax=Rhodovulum sulfidophilum TaxID=35806 RepID=A0A0D6B8U4_RHOSU|nr:hypothetical protein NHU_04425 [Rhodovulum sulfidophilum]
MCTRPIEQDGKVFACRTCDDCIATRRHNWVARAMAEKTGWPHTLCIALTYADDTEENRDAARMFCYADVRAFFARLRAAARRHAKANRLNAPPVIRFLCAGEQGDRNGRCHWHLIIYSNVDLLHLGEYRHRGRVVTKRPDMMSVGKRKIRLDWSLWGRGFVTLQDPDEGAMHYVLSYCLKDQFTEENSKGTMRYASAENFSTGLFRMSKRPAIGEQWLFQKMDRLLSAGAVIPKLEFRVPGLSGYWVPNGAFRKKALWALVALNKRILWTTGAPAPQWSSLVTSLEGCEADLEILHGLPQEEEDESIEFQLERRAREEAQRKRDAEIVRTCGRELPCRACLDNSSEEDLAALGVVRVPQEAGAFFAYRAAPGFEAPEARWKRPGKGINAHCRLSHLEDRKRVFPASADRSRS